MNLSALGITPAVVPSVIAARRYGVDAMQLLAAARVAWEQGASLVAIWASDDRDRERGFTLRVALRDTDGLTILEHAIREPDAQYPDLAPIFPSANRMQRAAYDLTGAQPGSDDQRPWLWQASWPVDQFPLRRDFVASPKWQPGLEDYPFVKVTGDGVHEIPVGPVHAGIIEPGHFRFQVVGEKVLRLEERLGYVHKGVEKRFEGMTVAQGAQLAGRISGDTTVGYALAFAHAVEALGATQIPARATWLRALLLERERLANHLGDLGYLGNDGGFAFGLAQFSRMREEVLRVNANAFGHRLLMDAIVPGGVARDIDDLQATALREQGDRLEHEIATLHSIYDEHAGLQDRFRTTGIVTSALATTLGVSGMAARASGIAHDLRVDHPFAPYDVLGVRLAVRREGDVAARVAVRFDEALESLRLVREIVEAMPLGEVRVPVADIPARLGLGWVEGWRGPVLIALEGAGDGTIRRCHPHDPSWENWPVIEHAVIGNIVPDFPLINKSFNLSYSGHDL